jgi:ABC-type dipeptide/oligopeptide/nickel transport system permease subunit
MIFEFLFVSIIVFFTMKTSGIVLAGVFIIFGVMKLLSLVRSWTEDPREREWREVSEESFESPSRTARSGRVITPSKRYPENEWGN